eukprot:CAMPEP_0184371846 /NCGR_PEP_ID=MMETSP1089-20130417/163626_1 /TAXON_ID=38269 ORGANISM="Gloeochaete wittrockiana, Strain SAG46.84" /NCGR_SAMPLE_ID=MMETSP1089 /ASSEMBLY_ACC=CAM_ASM_000445 /LENGTH=261 /DNA_ID=CAMNT_0026714647 /DNA_START=308 /DNA_END=1091 /DNA_ORIENTATION=-
MGGAVRDAPTRGDCGSDDDGGGGDCDCVLDPKGTRGRGSGEDDEEENEGDGVSGLEESGSSSPKDEPDDEEERPDATADEVCGLDKVEGLEPDDEKEQKQRGKRVCRAKEGYSMKMKMKMSVGVLCPLRRCWMVLASGTAVVGDGVVGDGGTLRKTTKKWSRRVERKGGEEDRVCGGRSEERDVRVDVRVTEDLEEEGPMALLWEGVARAELQGKVLHHRGKLGRAGVDGRMMAMPTTEWGRVSTRAQTARQGTFGGDEEA